MAIVQARTVLWYLVFVGFAVNYMIRINLNITIVEMVEKKEQHTITQNQTTHMHYDNATYQSNATAILKTGKTYNWNEYEQGLVLGSFFWAHWMTQVPGGILASKYGTKIVYGLSNAIGCWLCFLIPMASEWSYNALIWLRIIQGFITGLTWPAMHVLTAKWIPPNERSKFVTAYLGSSVGIAIFYPLFGYVMHWLSWEYVYYICGLIGTLWWFAWQLLVYDTPSQHPRISQKELEHIENSLGSTSKKSSKAKTPWRAILTSRPVWMNVIAQWGGIWGVFTLMTQAPTYFRFVHNWNIRATGFLSGFPHLMRMIFAIGFSIFADYLLNTDKISRTNLRKFATAITCVATGLLILALAYFGSNPIAAVILMTVATMCQGAVSSGPLASVVDISPNYAGHILGICGMIGVMPGFISSYIVGQLTLGNQTLEAWRNVFLVTGFMLIGCGMIYVLFGESTLQDWNDSSPQKADDVLKEIEPLSKIPIESFNETDKDTKSNL